MAKKTPLPKRLTMTEAAIYVAREHGVVVTRQTIYNWAKTGRKGTKLRMWKKAGRRFTTERAIDDFVASAD